VAKSHRYRDDETHMGLRERVQGLYVGLIFPAQGECPFFLTLEIGSGHRRGDEMPAYLS